MATTAPRNLIAATAIAFIVGDQATTLELGRNTIHALQPGGDRVRMALVLYMTAGALAASRAEPAAIIQGAAETYVPESPLIAQRVTSAVMTALGEDRVHELHARGAGMDWDQAVAYALTQTAQALPEPQSETQP